MRLSQRSMFAFALLSLALVPAYSRGRAPKLNYQQVQLLKDAQYYLLQVEGNLKRFDEQSAGWKAGDSTVDMRSVDQILGTRSQIDKYMENAENRFKQLPADNPDVTKEKDRSTVIAAHIEKTFSRLDEIKAGLAGIVKTGETPEFKKDYDRLHEINGMFADSQLLQREPTRDVKTVKQLANVYAERKRFAEKYAPLLNQSTPEAQGMQNQLQRFDETMKTFEAHAADFKAQTPAKIDALIKELTDSAKQAAAEKKPLWFGANSGIAAHLVEAQSYTDLLAAFDSSSAESKGCQARVDDARKNVAALAKTMEADILASSKVPEERFEGSDKEELIAKMKEKWATDGLGGDVLKAGMNSTGWRRETRWEWSGNAWSKVDYSFTQGYIVRKLNDEMAAIYYINFSKDHLAGDRISVGFFDDLKDEPSLERKIPIKNIS